MTKAMPWVKWYWSDWRSDPRLRMCSLAARGLWAEMLALMQEAEPYGHLVVNGLAPTDTQLAVLAGAPPEQIPDLLGELESTGVFSRTQKGVIYSRRMTRDERKSRKARLNGKTGGNPSLGKGKGNSASDNPPLKPPDNHGDNTQRPEARSQRREEAAQQSSTPPRASRKAEIDEIQSRLRDAAGLEDDPSPALLDLSPMLTLLGKGYDLDRDILPVLKASAASGKRGRTWRYYLPGIEAAKAGNDAIRPPPNGAGNGSKPAIDWDMAVRDYERLGGEFIEGNGPGQWGYRHDLPPDIQARFDAVDERLEEARKARFAAMQTTA